MGLYKNKRKTQENYKPFSKKQRPEKSPDSKKQLITFSNFSLESKKPNNDDDSSYIPSESDNSSISSVVSSDFEFEDDTSQAELSTGLSLRSENEDGTEEFLVFSKLHPVNLAAHFELLSENFYANSKKVEENQDDAMALPCLSELLDGLMCSLGPLICLTEHLTELNINASEEFESLLDNISYILPVTQNIK